VAGKFGPRVLFFFPNPSRQKTWRAIALQSKGVKKTKLGKNRKKATQPKQLLILEKHL
jgi:hypothetical protein